MAGQDDSFDAGIEGEEVECAYEVVGHGVREGIVFAGPVESDEDDRRGTMGACRDVGNADVLEW